VLDDGAAAAWWTITLDRRLSRQQAAHGTPRLRRLKYRRLARSASRRSGRWLDYTLFSIAFACEEKEELVSRSLPAEHPTIAFFDLRSDEITR
jgi:hypothetical protein